MVVPDAVAFGDDGGLLGFVFATDAFLFFFEGVAGVFEFGDLVFEGLLALFLFGVEFGELGGEFVVFVLEVAVVGFEFGDLGPHLLVFAGEFVFFGFGELEFGFEFGDLFGVCVEWLRFGARLEVDDCAEAED